MKQVFIVLLSSLFFLGCSKSIPTPKQRLHVTQELAKSNALHVKTFSTKNFALYAQYSKLTCKDIHVYIEGDGLAWITNSTISDDPTPINPVGLKLMVQDRAPCKLYLARPCQYVKGLTCKKSYWTSHRFSQKVIDSYNELLDSFKEKNFHLFGYSGGGAIATLLTANRDDVKSLVTIAGNLDIDLWVKKHSLTPLHGSLNPANYATKIQDIQQIHLVGEKDTIIDPSICQSYVQHAKEGANVTCKSYDDFTHHQGWVKSWGEVCLDLSLYRLKKRN